jgi:amino acid transporter
MSKGQTPRSSPAVPPHLGLWDTVSIIVGIIVGVGIYEAPADVFTCVAISASWQVLAVWLLGGILALLGALCIAELASTYPRSGGEYVYLTRAYGPAVGFVFAWAQFAIIRPGGGIAMPAYILAKAAGELGNLGRAGSIAVAVLAIAGLTFINVLGAAPGRRTQNLFTIAKVVSLAGIVLAGFVLARPAATHSLPPRGEGGSFIAMMVAVLYAYDGWNEAAYVAAEVRDRRRNLPRALLLGTLLVTLTYLLINAAYIVGFGFETAQTRTVGAAAILQQTLGSIGGQVMNVLVILSVLGALTGMIFTGSRLFSELGRDHPLFAPLGWWHPRLGTPVWSLTVQASISIAMVIGVALFWRDKDGFDVLLKGTAPVFWLFFLLTGGALFVLRYADRDVDRPFPVPGYPVVPLLFCGSCGFMLFGTLREVRVESLAALGILLVGLPLYWLSRRLERSAVPVDSAIPCDTLVGSEAGPPPGE